MEDDNAVRKLVELIFVKKYEVTSEMKAQNSHFPPYLLTNDFTQKLSHVLTVKKYIIYIKWAATFNVFYERDVMSDHKSYLISIIFNCLKEVKYQSNVFESFITLCSTVDLYSGETLRHAELNYCDLNTDIVMEVYKRVLRTIFIRRNGFRRFIEYIKKHKYLSWDIELVKRSMKEDPSDPLVDAMEKKIVNEVCNEQKTLHAFPVNLEGLEISAEIIAKYILSTTSVKLPTFSSDYDSKEAMNASSLKGPSKLRSSTKPKMREDHSTTSIELPTLSSDHDLEETVSALSLNDQSKLRTTTKSMTQEDPSTASVELSAASSDHDLEETASAPSLKDQSKLRTTTKSMTQEDASTTSVQLSTVSSVHDLEAVSSSSHNDVPKLHSSTKSLTQKDLSTASIEPSTLSKGYDSKIMVSDSNVEAGVKETTELNLKFIPNEMPHGFSSTYDKSYIETKQPDNIAWYESVVQEVIRYNQSKTADHVPVENSTQKIAGEVLEHLEDTIKTAIELLDVYDE